MGCPPGGVNDPAGTACAVVIVVPGRVRVARLSQLAAMADATVSAIKAISIIRLRIPSRPLLDSREAVTDFFQV